jgi:SAM-dependent methyltransferase
MNVQEHNSIAWDLDVEAGGEWSTPVSKETIENARRGEWEVILTPKRAVPREWFPAEMRDVDILCLASGGGQQAPIFAAAGANVTSFDNSAKQLGQDKLVAERDGLNIRLEKGDAADLSRFESESFDLIFHPVSNLFMPNLEPVWREAFRVLRRGGAMLAGFMNPFFYLFDKKLEDKGVLEVKYALPYSDVDSLSKEELDKLLEEKDALEFGHTLEQQIGGQIAAGFLIAGLYEDYWTDEATPLNKYTPLFIATKSIKI